MTRLLIRNAFSSNELQGHNFKLSELINIYNRMVKLKKFSLYMRQMNKGIWESLGGRGGGWLEFRGHQSYKTNVYVTLIFPHLFLPTLYAIILFPIFNTFFSLLFFSFSYHFPLLWFLCSLFYIMIHAYDFGQDFNNQCSTSSYRHHKDQKKKRKKRKPLKQYFVVLDQGSRYLFAHAA